MEARMEARVHHFGHDTKKKGQRRYDSNSYIL